MLPDVVKGMFAAVIKVKNLTMRGLSWIYRMGPISSHECKVGVHSAAENREMAA